jgi:hypothetical protein
VSELPASGGCVFSESGETCGDEDDVVFCVCELWTYLGGLEVKNMHGGVGRMEGGIALYGRWDIMKVRYSISVCTIRKDECRGCAIFMAIKSYWQLSPLGLLL